MYKPVQNLQLLRSVRQPHINLHQKPIQLGLRQRKCTCGFDWILSCNDKKRISDRPRLPVDCHLPLLHALQQAGLCTRGCTVDLISQDNIGKYRAFPKYEFSLLLVKIIQPRHIRRHKIWCKLNSGKLRLYRSGKCLCKHCFSCSRHILQQYMPACCQRSQYEIDYPCFSYNYFLDIRFDRLHVLLMLR